MIERSAGRLFAIAILVAGSGVRAQEGPPQGPPGPSPGTAPAKPRPDSLDGEVDQVLSLAKGLDGMKGREAIDRFLAKHTGNRRLLAHLPAIEGALQRCMYAASGPAPTHVQLLGRGATKYEPHFHRAEFRMKAFTEELGWRQAGTSLVFDVPFDGEVSVEVPVHMATRSTIHLAFDPASKAGCYSFRYGNDNRGAVVGPLAYRADPGAKEAVEIVRMSSTPSSADISKIRYALTADKVLIETFDGRKRRSIDSVAEKSYRQGYVGISGPLNLFGGEFVITGKIDRVFAGRQLSEAATRGFLQWRDSRYDRSAVLPAWILAIEDGSDAWIETLPDGVPKEARRTLALLQRAAFEGDGERPVERTHPGLDGIVGDWARALESLLQGRLAAARDAAERVAAAAPGFAPARTLVARVRLALGDVETARAILEESLRADPSFAPTYDGLAMAALAAGDFGRMSTVLKEAADRMTSTRVTGILRGALHRIERGPDWTKTYEQAWPHFVVSNDQSHALCTEIARTLEEAVDIYTRQFRPRPSPKAPRAPARVRVFSGYESYAEYVGGLGADPAGTLGVYLRPLRELCVFLHEDRALLSNTIRHEGFHQFLHDFLEDAPAWFDEGTAEFFGFSRRRKGKPVVGQVDPEQAALAAEHLPRFTPLPDLLRMARGPFMSEADVHYVQSWAVIHMLRESPEPTFRGLLDRYFNALLAGRSREEAYEDVFAPVIDRMEVVLRAHVRGLAPR